MIDPVEALMKTSKLLLPTSTGSSHVAPLPTVIPTNTPIVQKAGDVGNKTLW